MNSKIKSETIKLIDEFKENYELYNKRNRENGKIHGLTHCIQYGTYEGNFIVNIEHIKHFDNETLEFDNIEITEEEILKYLLDYNIYVFDYKELMFEIVGQTIIFSINHQNNKIFCKLSLFDNLNPNRSEIEDTSCDI